jgi:hypothetical protein
MIRQMIIKERFPELWQNVCMMPRPKSQFQSDFRFPIQNGESISIGLDLTRGVSHLNFDARIFDLQEYNSRTLTDVGVHAMKAVMYICPCRQMRLSCQIQSGND